MQLNDFLALLNSDLENVQFAQTIATVEQNYNYTPASFTNGETKNEAGTNEGSCKIFALAKLNDLSVEQTLHCFGDYYRKDVLENPQGEDHANIRNFIKFGWDGVSFESEALVAK